ncbi:MAG: hypothetical protein ACOYO1_20160, partial [Bacteroidales bacterium]
MKKFFTILILFLVIGLTNAMGGVGAPTITSFFSTSGGSGTNVIITGTNLAAVTDVSFGGIPASTFFVNDANSITVVVPSGTTGTISVATPLFTATSTGIFTYLIPNIIAFDNTNGLTEALQSPSVSSSLSSGQKGLTFTTGSSIVKLNKITFGVYGNIAGNADIGVNLYQGNGTGGTLIRSIAPTTYALSTIALGATIITWVIDSSWTLQPNTQYTLFAGRGPNASVIPRLAVSGLIQSSWVTNGLTFDQFTNETAASTNNYYIKLVAESVATPTITSFTPTTAGTGTTISISGTNFTGATEVKFGDTAAMSFTVVNANSITAVVASGATGTVSVTTGGGTVISTQTFTYCNTPSISSQSTLTQTQCLGGTFTPITVTATGDSLHYQWYSNTTASNSGGISLSTNNGAQTNSYTPQATASGTKYYYCVVTGTCGADTSAVSGAFIINCAPTDIALSASSINENVAANSTIGTITTTD